MKPQPTIEQIVKRNRLNHQLYISKSGLGKEEIEDLIYLDLATQGFDVIEIMNKHIEALSAELKEKDAALGFYADSDNWGHTDPGCATYDRIDKNDFGTGEFQISECTDDERVGGKLARQVLQKYRVEK
jgi:hypothetical protein